MRDRVTMDRSGPADNAPGDRDCLVCNKRKPLGVVVNWGSFGGRGFYCDGCITRLVAARRKAPRKTKGTGR